MQNLNEILEDFNLPPTPKNIYHLKIHLQILKSKQELYILSLQYPLYRYYRRGRHYHLQPVILHKPPLILTEIKQPQKILKKTYNHLGFTFFCENSNEQPNKLPYPIEQDLFSLSCDYTSLKSNLVIFQDNIYLQSQNRLLPLYATLPLHCLH